MGLKLLNTTVYDDKALIDVLSYAHKKIGVSGITLAKITYSRRIDGSGFMIPGKPFAFQLTKKGLSPHDKGQIIKKIHNGWVRLSLPYPRIVSADDSSYIAEQFSYKLHFTNSPMSKIIEKILQSLTLLSTTGSPLQGEGLHGRVGLWKSSPTTMPMRS